MSNNSHGCHSFGNRWCEPVQTKRQIIVDFLYLDLSICERCQGTESNIDEVSGGIKGRRFWNGNDY